MNAAELYEAYRVRRSTLEAATQRQSPDIDLARLDLAAIVQVIAGRDVDAQRAFFLAASAERREQEGRQRAETLRKAHVERERLRAKHQQLRKDVQASGADPTQIPEPVFPDIPDIPEPPAATPEHGAELIRSEL